ncbi:Phosphatidate cytidylyltransferase [Spraguea lophii 42_110]|uniref:Phosphatidate cytidylyltransferase n=1 Tax=Spraguea lophii (strain 42_110) TaxID=1358809 RepID=S7XG72_SPRLO|nr:Phosphatidate cytidylyltransferase [Spraguea lophii 42_110]
MVSKIKRRENTDKTTISTTNNHLLSNITNNKIFNYLMRDNIMNSNFFKRVILAIIMLTLFSFISKYKVAISILIYFIKIFTYKEIIDIHQKHRRKGSFYFLLWYFLFLSDIFLFKYSFKYLNVFGMEYIFRHFNFFCFSCYIGGLIFFIIHLKKGNLKIQFIQFAISHLSIILINLPSHLAIHNTMKSRYWFCYPTLLVIANDIFAYMVGKTLGRTPLIKLSPKKTLEGYIGGIILTAIFGILINYLTITQNIFISNNDLLKIDGYRYILGIKIHRLWIHSLPFIFFASIIAPFGGFFASGFKRLTRIKDFANYIPGHGGIADRMDCQYVMAIFTYVYINTFIKEKKTVEQIALELLRKYDTTEIKQLLDILKNSI